MKLIELNPNWLRQHTGHKGITHLSFDCPKCQKHRITIPILPWDKGWEMKGESYENATITPSIAHTEFVYTNLDNEPKTENDPTQGYECKSHFFITNGEIQIL